MKIAAAYAIGNMVSGEEVRENFIIPDALNRNVAKEVEKAVKNAAVSW
ncbi:MAG TPA: hypothetical protein VK071_00260 [Tissierellales bacterium]|nr:hypothetical protein [Tissierellales bacterium]